MNITKAIHNYALRRGIELQLEDEQVRFWEIEQDCEWMFSYSIAQCGCLFWKGNVYLPRDIKEELPAMIGTDKKLKEVLDFIHKEFISKK
ncbi:hypothetical protein [Escherichia coli]|uniref:hypothetical protein n=1 Tax=Escherichia coli TaxID=562 RepID=UPI00235E821E|nr:hypothetical protein [Escherichia coli]